MQKYSLSVGEHFEFQRGLLSLFLLANFSYSLNREMSQEGLTDYFFKVNIIYIVYISAFMSPIYGPIL